MSTLSVVAISVFSVIFVLFLLAAASMIIYAHVLLRRELSRFSTLLQSSDDKIAASFQHIEGLVRNVQGDEIRKAAQIILEIFPKISKEASRMEQAITAFRSSLEWLQRDQGIPESDLDRARSSGLLPNSYAPAEPGEHYISRSATAASDAQSLLEESVDNSSGSAGYPADTDQG